VTRLGEFSPIGWLFTLAKFMKITEVAEIFFATFFPRQVSYAQSLTKKVLGHILADFFKNSSGHPFSQLQIFGHTQLV
jgi:hypothetical protein